MKAKQKIIFTGWSQSSESLKAGEETARMALGQMDPEISVGWALAFCGGRHDPGTFLRGLRSQFGEVDVVGGSAVGTITNDMIGYTGFECSIAAFPASIPKPTILSECGLDKGEKEVGQKLGSRLQEIVKDGDNVILFYDSVRSGPPPILNTGSKLLDAVYLGLAGRQINLIGAGTVGDFQLTNSYVFDGHQNAKQTAVAVVLPSVLSAHTIIMHGCIPISSFLEITKIEGPVVYEIDGRPALEVLNDIFDNKQDNVDKDNLSLSMTLGRKHGDPSAPYDESSYVNRLIMSTNPEDGSVTLFEADFEAGTKIQIMARDNQLMLESVKKRTRELLDSLGSLSPILGFYIDCAGRSSAFIGSEFEDAAILQTELGKDIPLLGFYSGVELAPLLGRSRPLDWTGVLTLFSLENGFGE